MLLSILYFVIILGIIILVHEFGHYFFSKLFGVYVYEFALGMGPAILSKKSKAKKDKKNKIFSPLSKSGETTYSIRAIPIGGYCQLAGEDPSDEEDLPKNRLLNNKPIWQRALIMFFGAGNNFILAIVTLFIIALVWGAPTNKPMIRVVEDSPAGVAGLVNGDIVTRINGDKVKTLDDLQLYLTIVPKGDVKITVNRDGKNKTFTITPLSDEEAEEKGYTVGIGFEQDREYGFISSVKYSFTKTGALIRQLAITLKELFTGGVGVGELSGPVGIYKVVDETRSTGFANLLYLLAVLCINVGFINLIPFPAFDGGRILFLLIEKIKGSPVKPETENLIHNIGFFILLGLIILITIKDIIKLF